MADKYAISPKRADAKQWCANWYSYHQPETVEECREILYPCHTFNHVKGFAAVTKLLAYENAGHVTEKRPKGVNAFHLRLDHRIMQQVNAAKGRLKTILHQELYAPIKAMLNDKANHCLYKEKVVWAYLEAFTETMAWPVEDLSAKNSIDDCLSRLRRFECEDPHPNGKASCFRCRGDFENTDKSAVSLARRYFDGLCLDCLYNSKTGDKDKDYWELSKAFASAHGRYDKGCRVRQGEPSCYFSCMASRKDFDEWGFAQD